MDYDWKYYIDGLRSGKSRITITETERMAAGQILNRLPRKKREQLRGIVQNMLNDYRHHRDHNALIEDAIRQHTEYCKERADDELLKRRHNAIVYRYMMNTALHNKAAAGKLGISRETFISDIGKATDELLTILFGVPVMVDSSEGKAEALKCLFENVRLLKYGFAISQRFAQAECEQERIRCMNITGDVLQSIKKAVQMYGEYVKGCLTARYKAERSLEVIRALYLDEGSRTIQEIAAEQGVSQGTVYADLKKTMENFAELFEYMVAAK